MTCLTIEPAVRLDQRSEGQPSKWDVARTAFFWGAILLVIVSPAVLSALILMQV